MRTNHIFFTILMMLVSMTFYSCEDGMPDYYHEKEYPSLTGFTGVELGDALQVEIRRADAFSVVAKGEDKDLNDLELWVENNSLRGKYREGSRSHKRTLVLVYMPELKKTNMHSATNTKIIGFPAGQELLHLIVSGASEVELENSWNELSIEISGASKAILHGYGTTVTANVSGSSELNAEGFTTENGHMEVNGKSTARVRIGETLTGSVNGDSKLIYWGNPTEVQVAVASDSEMQARD